MMDEEDVALLELDLLEEEREEQRRLRNRMFREELQQKQRAARSRGMKLRCAATVLVTACIFLAYQTFFLPQ